MTAPETTPSERPWAGNVTVILVEPWEPGNIGSAARAMRNTGFHRLTLVRPRDPHADACQMMAVGAYPLVQQARITDSFLDAVAEEEVLVGTTSTRGRRPRGPVRSIREAAPEIASLARSRRVGLVFGPERRGLDEEVLAACRFLVTVPTNPEFPVLNLAQAVLTVCYELSLVEGQEPTLLPDLASQADREQMFEHLQETLLNIGFLSRSNPGHIMRSLRRLLARADLTRRDIRILRGIMSQMDWYITTGRDLPSERVIKK